MQLVFHIICFIASPSVDFVFARQLLLGSFLWNYFQGVLGLRTFNFSFFGHFDLAKIMEKYLIVISFYFFFPWWRIIIAIQLISPYHGKHVYIFEGSVILLLYPYLFIICICYKRRILYSFLFEKLIDLFKTFNWYKNERKYFTANRIAENF